MEDNGQWEEDQMYAMPLNTRFPKYIPKCNFQSQGNMLEGIPVSQDVQQTFNVAFTTYTSNYDKISLISDQVNGVTFYTDSFLKSNTPAGTQVPVILKAYGTPQKKRNIHIHIGFRR